MLCDLAQLGEVSWADETETGSLLVRETCCCPGPDLRRWHQLMIDRAEGRPLAARFTLNPLIGPMWDDTAARLAELGIAAVKTSRLPFRHRPRYQVAEASARATALSQAVRQGTHSRFERTLISLAWATGSLDDLFKVHGVTVGAALTDAARDLVSKDPLTTHLEAACAYSNSIAIPYIPAGP